MYPVLIYVRRITRFSFTLLDKTDENRKQISFPNSEMSGSIDNNKWLYVGPQSIKSSTL